MIVEVGMFCLIMATVVAALQATLPLAHGAVGQSSCHRAQRGAALAQFLCLTISFYALIYAYLTSDFSVIAVRDNSHTAMPALYKFTGSWANHEGSILLWAWILSLFGFFLARRRSSGTPPLLHSYTLAIHAVISLGVLLFILFTSNPLMRAFPQPPEGADLNPLLQDIGLALHPPMLYLGYIGFSMVFSLSVAALLRGRMDRQWAKTAHPWIMASWSFLTLGIGLGGWWAYRELGWGGWWFWDPVENASLLPWLAGTALLHSNLVLAKRGIFQRWVALLAILTFSLSLLGTFLVRSGLLTSVHAFASDPGRGVFILAYITCITGGALWIYARKPLPESAERIGSMMTREGGIVLNNLFLVAGCATILLATCYPLVMQALGSGTVSIGPPYYVMTFIPLMVPVVLLAAIAPFLSWKHPHWPKDARRYLYPAGIAALLTAGAVIYMQMPQAAFSALGMGLAAWLAAGSLGIFLRAGQWGRISLRQSFQRLWLQPGSLYAMVLGHAALAILVAGITGSGLWQREAGREIVPGDTVALPGYHVTYLREESSEAKNYSLRRQFFSVEAESDEKFVLSPEIRHYPVRDHHTSEAAIRATALYDFYAVTGLSPDKTALTARLYFNPLMQWLWAGCLLMAAAGAISWIAAMRRR